MLNELGEYAQYAAPLDTLEDDAHRLKYFTLIKKNFSGLERALTIVARHHLFADTANPHDFNRVKNILRAWCGFHFDDDNIPRELVNRLPDYIRRIFLRDADDDRAAKISAALENLRGKEKSFDRGLFTVSDKNDFRAIKFDKIIANALELGSLRNFVLVCEHDPFDDCALKKITAAKPAGKNLTATDRDLILKLTAIRLLYARHSDQNFAPLNELNLFNWLASDSKPETFNLDKFIFGNGERLFDLRIVGGVKVKKFRVLDSWLENFRLVDARQLNDTRGRIFFTDSGRAEPLQKNFRR